MDQKVTFSADGAKDLELADRQKREETVGKVIWLEEISGNWHRQKVIFLRRFKEETVSGRPGDLKWT